MAFPPASQPVARRRKSDCRATKRTFGDAGDGVTRTMPQLMLKGVAACAIVGVVPRPASAQEGLKMGISIPMTGAGFNAVGRQLAAAIKLYVEQHGDTIAGRKLEIILRDDAGVADNARRIVQEMIVNERVGLVGIGITPTSLAIAPLVTEARMPTLVLSSGASVTVTKSPYMVRAGFVVAQQSWIMAEWAAKNGSKRAVTLVNDWAPGVEAETAFRTRFIQAGGQIIVLHCLKGRKLDVVELPVYLFDLADIDVVHDIAGLRIDVKWAARAFPSHALHRRQQGIAVGSAAGPFQSFVDQVHAVVPR